MSNYLVVKCSGNQVFSSCELTYTIPPLWGPERTAKNHQGRWDRVVFEVWNRIGMLYSKSQAKNVYGEWGNDQSYQILMINQYRTRYCSLDLTIWISLDVLLTREALLELKYKQLAEVSLRGHRKM